MNFQETIDNKRKETLLKHDKIIFIILLAHLPVTMFLIPMGYDTHFFAFWASAAVGIATLIAYFIARGTRLFGIISAMLLMSLSAIMIQSQMGRIEMHFHIFGAIALLLIYRDWIAVLTAAGFIAAHHLLFTALQLGAVQMGSMPLMIFDYGCSWGIAFLHAAFVVFEAAILIYYALMMKKEELNGLQLMAAVTAIQRDNNLSIRLPSEEGNAVSIAFNNLIEEFDKLISHLSSTSDRLASTSGELNSNSQQASENITVQHEQIEQAVTAMSEMSKTIHDVAHNSQQAAVSASEADSEANKGEELVNKVVSRASQLENSMSSASEAMNQLEENVENIGSVVGVIKGISEQTNLLALNAAIEAARAGEQGRGFAVVADEVRTLAQRTQESTEDIQQIIESLQSVTGKAVSSINSGQERTIETAEKINEAGTALHSIVDSVSKISNMNMQIAAAAEQQAAVADSVSDNIASISRLSDNAVVEVDSNLNAAKKLQSMSKEINQSIVIYK